MAEVAMRAVQYEVRLKLDRDEWLAVLDSLRFADSSCEPTKENRYGRLLKDLEKDIDIP